MGRPNKGASSVSSSPLPSGMDGKIRDLIVKDDAITLIEVAEDIAQKLSTANLTTSQIRNVFGTVRQIQLSWSRSPAQSFREAVLLRPKLGYFAKRERGKGMEILEAALVPALKAIEEAEKEPAADRDKVKRERFMRFADFFEAIVAYHKKYGGKEN